MLPLNDSRWLTFEGGYRVACDASALLRTLEAAPDAEAEGAAWDELWTELYHQGDVGAATYHAVPHVVRIAASKPALSVNPFAFVAAVEAARHRPGNPPLPPDAEGPYRDALASVLSVVAAHADRAWDADVAAAVFSAVAAAKGHVKLSMALAEMDPATTQTFLASQIGYEAADDV